ncbi:MAG TPA: TraR/DksA C4-type zinc finger protein [Gemmataceae bacterium]|nr:TraR/DksA C4-type zinc finger protein [Gemmataceae bacterium]
MRSRSDLSAFRSQLLALLNRAEEVRSVLATETDRQAVAADGVVDPFRPAELHSRAAEEVVTTQLLGLEAGVEREVLAALERIDRGTFGKCERCGNAIPKGRLEAIPYTRTCVRCAG